MRKHSFVVSFFTACFLLLVFVLPCACKAQPEKKSGNALCVASWNVQNLFDAVDDGSEYDEYTAKEGWNENAYKRRLSSAASILECLPSSEECIVVLNEVENPNVVNDLLSQKVLSEKNLQYFAFAKETNGAIGLAVASSIPISSAKVHKVDDGTRPILEVGFETSLGKLFVLAVHFKSNIGGTDETATLRFQASYAASQVSSYLKSVNPGCLILICGDFNEECWDENSMGREVDSVAPLKVSSGFESGKWNCFWLQEDFNPWPGGSYYYQGLWKCYDNILISQTGKDGVGYEFSQAGIVFSGALRGSDDKPNAWNRNLLKGVSDHLPIWVLFDSL